MESSYTSNINDRNTQPAPTFKSGEALTWITRDLGGQCSLPQNILLLMFCLLSHHHFGRRLSSPSMATIALETRMAEIEVSRALRSAQELQLITQRSITVTGVIEWRLNYGHIPPPQQLGLWDAVWAKTRYIKLNNRDRLCLEACLRAGFNWTTGEVVITQAELAKEIPTWTEYMFHRALKSLSAIGLLVVVKKGHGRHPSIRRLVLPESVVRDSYTSGRVEPGSRGRILIYRQ